MKILIGIGIWVIATAIIMFFFVGADANDNYEEWDGERDEQ